MSLVALHNFMRSHTFDLIRIETIIMIIDTLCACANFSFGSVRITQQTMLLNLWESVHTDNARKNNNNNKTSFLFDVARRKQRKRPSSFTVDGSFGWSLTAVRPLTAEYY